jgi:hypothetical protein
VAVERLVRERQKKTLGCSGNLLLLDDTGNHLARAFDLPPLNGTTSRERIWGCSKPREATNATRKEGTG